MYVGKQAISLQKTALLEIVFMMKLLQFQKQKQNKKLTRTKKAQFWLLGLWINVPECFASLAQKDVASQTIKDNLVKKMCVLGWCSNW